MLRGIVLATSLLLAAGAPAADEPPVAATVAKADVRPDAAAEPQDAAGNAQAKAEPGSRKASVSDRAQGDSTTAKSLLGISILGNQEAPKALVIVPWKSSQLGDTLGISQGLDDSRQPVDRDVFMRELGYYEIRSGAE